MFLGGNRLPALEDTQILIVALYLVIILMMFSFDVSSGHIYGIFGSVIGLSFGFYVMSITSDLFVSTAIVVTFLVVMARTIGELIDERTEV